MRGKWDFRHEEAKGQFRGGGSGHRRKNVLHPPTVTGTRIMNLPPPGKNDFHRGLKPRGPKAGEGKGRLPGSPPRGLGLPPGRPSVGGVSHSHRERGRGTGERVGGPLRRQLLGRRVLSGGDSGVFSLVAASSRFPQATAAAAGSTWLPRMHRAGRATPPVGEKRKV